MTTDIPVLVRTVSEVVPGIKQFSLRRTDGGALPPYSGGSHVVVTLRGAGQRLHRNAYSLMGDPQQQCYRSRCAHPHRAAALDCCTIRSAPGGL